MVTDVWNWATSSPYLEVVKVESEKGFRKLESYEYMYRCTCNVSLGTAGVFSWI